MDPGSLGAAHINVVPYDFGTDTLKELVAGETACRGDLRAGFTSIAFWEGPFWLSAGGVVLGGLRVCFFAFIGIWFNYADLSTCCLSEAANTIFITTCNLKLQVRVSKVELST
jgi:hypothetical protein